MSSLQKPLIAVPVDPPGPPGAPLPRRGAAFASADERRTRYHLPESLDSASPVGYRVRVPLTRDEAAQALQLLALERPTAFASAPGATPTEGELFEEHALGVLTARQSTNYRGQRVTTLGPEGAAALVPLLAGLSGREAAPLAGAAYAHVVFSKPYRTPFTMLLTLAGHKPVASLVQVPVRIVRKRYFEASDIPTIGYLQDLHVGILADAMERAVVVASAGRRRAQVFMAPFAGRHRKANRELSRGLEDAAGLTGAERREGWRVSLVVLVGGATPGEAVPGDAGAWRRIGANLMALRSERIQPGVNQEEKAPAPYGERQVMDVGDDFTEQAGRAAFNAFAHWTGIDRERAKALLLLERIDVLTPNGKQRLREVRQALNDITDHVIRDLPLWADLPTGKVFSRNAEKGRKAFALAGQRIYIGGLARAEVEAAGLDFLAAVRAFGAAASRSALYCELMGTLDLPTGCDLLAGTCVMAGPVNQNDIGKQFYGYADLLAGAFPGREPTSLLVWTLKAKTVADPIGNEEQLLSRARKGALVDLRCGPHEAVRIQAARGFEALRDPKRHGRTSQERAFAEVGNFVTDADGREIPGNRGSAWPGTLRNAPVWGA